MPKGYRVYDGAYPHFITSAIAYWIPVFCRKDYFEVIADSLRYCIEHKGLVVHGYVVMPNHIHLICSQVDMRISQVIGDFKRHTSSQILKKLSEDCRTTWLSAFKNAGGGQPILWNEGFHPMQVHTREFFQQKLDYMHDNPIRAGFVENAEDWKYSSAGFYYCEKDSVVPITPIEF